MANTTDTQIASGRRTTPPFRADHVGSLLRPRRLLEAREDLAKGTITAAQLRTIEDEEITKLVQMQRDVGLQSATDGELRRGSWHMDFIYQLGGIERVQGDIEVRSATPTAPSTSSRPRSPSMGRCTWTTPSSSRTSSS